MLRKTRTRVIGAIDDLCLEVVEVAPAGAARIGDRGDADAEREPIGIDAVVAGVRPFLAGAREDVGVDVDEPRCHVQAGDVHHLEGFRRIDRGATAAICPAAIATS